MQKTGSRKESAVRKWIIFPSAAIVLLLFFTLVDFESEPSYSSVDGVSDEAVVEPDSDSEQNDPHSMNTDEIESSQEQTEFVAVIPPSGRVEHEIEIRRLLKEIIYS